MNYFSLCAIASLMFVYTYKKKNFDLSSSILSVLFSIIFIIHLEAFTLDRIAVLYFMLILYFLDRKNISYFLIILAALVNEKIIFIMCILFFIRWIFLKDRKYLNYFFAAMISGIIMILIFDKTRETEFNIMYRNVKQCKWSVKKCNHKKSGKLYVHRFF